MRKPYSRKALVLGLGAISTFALFSLFQNFSEFQFPNYEYTVIDLGNLGGSLEQAKPSAINRLGHVAGQSHNKEGYWHAFLWTPKSGMQDLGTLGGNESRALALNDKDEVFGVSTDAKNHLRRFQWVAGLMKDLGEVEKDWISFDDQFAVGSVPYRSGSLTHAAIWESGKVTDLSVSNEASSLARGFNSKGDAVGEAVNPSGILRPVLWIKDNGKASALDLFAEFSKVKLEGRAFSINENRQAVGQAMTSQSTYAFTWSPKTGTQDLNKLVRDSDPDFMKSTWTFTSANAVNGCGFVVGEGKTIDKGAGRAFLLTPIKASSKCKE